MNYRTLIVFLAGSGLIWLLKLIFEDDYPAPVVLGRTSRIISRSPYLPGRAPADAPLFRAFDSGPTG